MLKSNRHTGAYFKRKISQLKITNKCLHSSVINVELSRYYNEEKMLCFSFIYLFVFIHLFINAHFQLLCDNFGLQRNLITLWLFRVSLYIGSSDWSDLSSVVVPLTKSVVLL